VRTTHRFRITQMSDGGLFYELAVDDVPVGRDDFLGIEQSFPVTGAPAAILDLMVRRGVQRTTATAFLWAFLEERKKREATGAALVRWEESLDCDR
jgi:hypothetical protein